MRKPPPQNLEAEQAVLGSMLIEPSAIVVAGAALVGSDFYRDAHRTIFEAVQTLHTEKQPIDLLTLPGRLRAIPGRMEGQSALDECGGLVYLQNLMEAPSSAANIGYYCSMVREPAVKRHVMEQARIAYETVRDDPDGLTMIAAGNGHFNLSKIALSGPRAAVRTVCLADVQTETVSYLWRPWIAFGKVTIVNGDPGIFKSGISLDIVARLTTGRPMPFCEIALHEPMNALLLVGEDGLGDTVKPRLIASGADLSRVISYGYDNLPDLVDIDRLEREVILHEIKIIVIDPLNAFIPAGIDINSGPSVRRLLSPLKRLAEAHGIAVLILSHLNKSTTQGNALYRSSGSADIPGAARSVILCAKAPGSDTEFVFASVKNNLAKPPQALSYHVESAEGEDSAPFVVWDGISEQTANTLVTPQNANFAEERDKITAAQEFLAEFLADSAKAAQDVIEAAHEAGHTKVTLNRAKPGMVHVRKVGSGAGSFWQWELKSATEMDPKIASLLGKTPGRFDYLETDDRRPVIDPADLGPMPTHLLEFFGADPGETEEGEEIDDPFAEEEQEVIGNGE
jgi:hypothetical protein